MQGGGLDLLVVWRGMASAFLGWEPKAGHSLYGSPRPEH